MPTTHTPPTEPQETPTTLPRIVIYIGQNLNDFVGGAQARMAKELTDSGVVIHHLTPTDLIASRTNGGGPLANTIAQLTNADLVAIGDTVHHEHMLAVVLLRRGGTGETWVDRGWEGNLRGVMYFADPTEKAPFVVMSSDGMIPALFTRHTTTPPHHVAPKIQAATREALPMPFRDSVWGFTENELYSRNGRATRVQAINGIVDPFEAAQEFRTLVQIEIQQRRRNGDPAGWRNREPLTWFADHFVWMMKFLPTNRLGELGSTGVAELWETLASEDSEVASRECDRVIWEALVRDGGRETLAGLPAAMADRKVRLAGEWDGVLARAYAVLPERRFSMSPIQGQVDEKLESILASSVIPEEDPFEDEQVGPTYLPTLHTLRVARRYRPATEVVMLACQLYGARPFVRDDIGEHLARFVAQSPPTSEQEAEDWCRVIQMLAAKRSVHRRVVDGCRQWTVMPFAVYDALVATAPWLLNEHGSHVSENIPWLGRDGEPMARWMSASTQPQGAMESFARRGERRRQNGGPHVKLLPQLAVKR